MTSFRPPFRLSAAVGPLASAAADTAAPDLSSRDPAAETPGGLVGPAPRVKGWQN